ncbi:L-type lectin-domain containing receptor kinase IX.1-like [Hevea brasiliensis]|uniref:L-type lectin-domain containing receptor kinase IX.1-like n=1 Tax=Hevea brasiliensis TaxID=3981 RepID=UPI0025ED498C|nr:L-type lectin-domain containing receptor kinase IX.1-like [Hevea brasiliensis]
MAEERVRIGGGNGENNQNNENEARGEKDKRTGIVTDFNTHFSFVINSLNNVAYGDGMAFFMAPQGSKIPAQLTHGSTLGLTSDGDELNSTSNPFVAIEFSIFRDNWDPPYDHVGIDANSMKCVKNEKWLSDVRKEKLNDAWISYNSSTKTLSVVFTGIGNSKVKEDESFTAQLTEQEFETATAAKMMPYGELNSATYNFDEKNKLEEGGFSAVYRGFLMFKYIAVKKFKRVSIHGLKHYASEVMITGKLKHENLIKLIGWCYEKEQLLLVFEYMPNLSLDYHLFKGTKLLKWVERYKIALGLASALHYMHQGCERCVLHRDIKSSNVLLDSNFNAKLADFGLARLVSHDAKSQTLEGWTNGYEAPECHQTGKSSKMSDVYSFGVVALEIACGRRAFVQMDDGNHVRLVKWVWDHYERDNLLEAADQRLCGKFDENQMKRLMMVGLWCAHPGFSHRPSAGEALEVLKFNAAPPNLPSKFPEARYAPAPAGPSF